MEINENLFDGIAVIARPHGDTDGDSHGFYAGSHVPNPYKNHFIYPDFSQWLNIILGSSNVGMVVNNIVAKESRSRILKKRAHNLRSWGGPESPDDEETLNYKDVQQAYDELKIDAIYAASEPQCVWLAEEILDFFGLPHDEAWRQKVIKRDEIASGLCEIVHPTRFIDRMRPANLELIETDELPF